MGGYFLERRHWALFFEDDNGSTQTINKERYVQVLEKFKTEQHRRFSPGQIKKFYFQQDGAAPHTSNLALDWLKCNFRSRVNKTAFEWAPHSPDLSPPDYFLWGYLKDKVYKTRPQSIEELKENIRAEMQAIPLDTCKAVMENFTRRLELCREQNGGHLEQLL